MKAAAASVALRYCAIAIQFAVVIAITRALPLDMAGRYFSVFGVIAVTFTLSGLGLPDGIAREANAERARGASTPHRVIHSYPWALLINLGLCVGIGWVAVRLAHLPVQHMGAIAAWWFGYAGTFLFAQMLIGANRPVLATFFAYSAINLSYVVTLLPVLVLASQLSLQVVFWVAAAGANLAMLGAGVMALRRSGWPQGLRAITPQATRLTKIGFPMMIARLMQASLPWIPVWMLGYFHAPEWAAIYGAASRLTVAVTSVVAALRFSMRGRLVEMDVQGRFAEMAALNRRVSLVSAVPPILGLVGLLWLGHPVVPMILGPEYGPAVLPLTILMGGVLAEAFGGLSDEILKMTGRARIVLWSLVASILCQIGSGIFLAPNGAAFAAWGTVLAFAIQYLWQVLWLTRHTPIAILPWPARKEP